MNICSKLFTASVTVIMWKTSHVVSANNATSNEKNKRIFSYCTKPVHSSVVDVKTTASSVESAWSQFQNKYRNYLQMQAVNTHRHAHSSVQICRITDTNIHTYTCTEENQHLLVSSLVKICNLSFICLVFLWYVLWSIKVKVQLTSGFLVNFKI